MAYFNYSNVFKVYLCYNVHENLFPFYGWIISHCVCVYLCVHAQLCQTRCHPMDHSLPGSSVHGIFQARILEWVAISFSRGSSWLRDWTHVFCISCIGRWILYHWATWEAYVYLYLPIFIYHRFYITSFLIEKYCFHLFAIVNNAIMNIGAWLSIWFLSFNLFDIFLGLKLVDHMVILGEGNGTPLQCSCLENPRDRGAYWAAVYGVTQSQTRLKRLSSSSSSSMVILHLILAETLNYFPQQLYHFIFQSVMLKGFNFSTSSPTLINCCFFLT